jgi:hypothetical protein
MPPGFRIRYVEGNWRYINDPNALFSMRLIDQMTVDHLPKSGRRTPGNDVAREGDDNNVFSLIIGDTLADLAEPKVEIGDEIPVLNQLADEYIGYLGTNQVGYQSAWVDAVGVGGGVVDNCRKRGYFVNSYKSGERPTRFHPCTTCGRTEACDHAGQMPMYERCKFQTTTQTGIPWV